MKKLFAHLWLLAFSLTHLHANEHEFSHYIDFSQYRSTLDNPELVPDAWFLGFGAFNFAPELTSFFAFLKQKYQIDTLVETGTYEGISTACFSHLFDSVHTIEISGTTYDFAKERLKECPNVHCHLGSSEVVLRDLLPILEGKRVLFYLDAHWGPHWPLLEEIEEISKTHRDNCIIVIDDFKVPGRQDINYDHYGPHDCSYEYIRTQLDKVYSSYDYHYLIPRSVRSKAKFVAIPKQWIKHDQEDNQ